MKKALQLFRLFSLSLLGLFLACEEPVTLDLGEVMPEVVVNGVFTNHQSFHIVLTKSNPLLLNESTEYIDNAKVVILGADNKVLGVLAYQEDAFLPSYQLEGLVPSLESFYQLSIELPDYPSLSAMDYLPKPVPLKKISVDTIHFGTDVPINILHIGVAFKDPGGSQRNFYHLRLFHEEITGRTRPDGFQEYDDSHLLPLPISSIPTNMPKATFDRDQIGILFSDEDIDNQMVQLELIAKINELEAGPYPKIVGELRSVSENYYQYYTSLARQEESKDRPFAEPVSVFSNIENGLGIFAGFSVHRDSITIVQ